MSPHPTDLPDDHPLAQTNGVLDDHSSHVSALAEFFDTVDPDEVRSLMLIVTTEDSTDTIPSMRDGADFESCVWYQLAAHISHVASSFDAEPEQVAKHACHVLRDQQQDVELHGPGVDGGGERL